MADEVLSLIPQTPEPLAQHYGVMHSAVMETARGRWFLHEYARRNRNADTTALLAAIDRIQAALNIKTAIPAASHDATRAHDQRASQETTQAAPPSAELPPQGMAAPFAHQLYELRDAILLTKDSLPAVGPNSRILQRIPDFHRIAKGIGIVAARMRWIAEQVPDAQNRSIVNAYEELDKLVEGANMVAALLAEVESRIGGIIEALETPAAEPAADAAANEVGESGLEIAEPRIVHHAEPQAAEPEEPVDPEWLDRLAPPLRQYYPPSGLPIDPLNFEFHDPQPSPMPNPAWREEPLPPRPAPAASPPPAAPPVVMPPPVNPRTVAPATPPIRPRRGAPAATPPVFHSRRAPVAPPVFTSLPVAAAPAPTPPAAAPQSPAAFASPAVPHVPVPNVFAAYSVTLRAVLPQSLQPPAAAQATARPPAPAVEIPYTVADHAPAMIAEEPARPVPPAAAARPRDPLAAIAALSDEEKIALFS